MRRAAAILLAGLQGLATLTTAGCSRGALQHCDILMEILAERRMRSRNSRIGLVLFLLYLLLYGGFVLLNTFSPQTMEAKPFAGVNVAILYGFGLIISAFVLALIYGVFCGPSEGQK